MGDEIHGLTVKRLDIWLANLFERDGSEQAGVRPVLILQNDVGNLHSPTVIVSAITDADKRYLPTHVYITAQSTGLSKNSTILFEQVFTIDKARLIKKVGRLPERLERVANRALSVSLSLRR